MALYEIMPLFIRKGFFNAKATICPGVVTIHHFKEDNLY